MAYSLVKEKTPRTMLSDFFPNLESWTVGFDREWQILEELQNSLTGGISSYPPYNIKQSGEDGYEIEMAVAGFNKDKLKVELENNRLVIEGNQDRKEEKSEADYVYKGIASRHFRQSFALADHMKVKECELKDGILKIQLERKVPEDMKPRMIEIK